MSQQKTGPTGPNVTVLPTIEDIHLPPQYRRRPIDEKEIAYINVSIFFTNYVISCNSFYRLVCLTQYATCATNLFFVKVHNGVLNRHKSISISSINWIVFVTAWWSRINSLNS